MFGSALIILKFIRIWLLLVFCLVDMARRRYSHIDMRTQIWWSRYADVDMEAQICKRRYVRVDMELTDMGGLLSLGSNFAYRGFLDS